MSLTGKPTLITGASRGIGEATARHFAQRGAPVALAARGSDAIERIAAEIRADGGQAIAVACDVSSYDDVTALVEQTLEAFGGLGILINNAGRIEPIARLAESDPSAWGQVVDVNLKGVYHGLRCAIPVMQRAGGGVIVNVSSGAATGVLEGWSHYCASKAAVLSLTRCAHLETAEHGIRVVGISPGTVATGMQTAIRASGVNRVSQLDPSVHIPTEWVARAIEFLCGEDGAELAGGDFSLGSDEGRRRVGLPLRSD